MDIEAQRKFVIENYLKLPVKQIAREIGRSATFVYGELKKQNLTIPEEIKLKWKKNSLIKPGSTPPNKGKKVDSKVYNKIRHTFFQPGIVPHNTKYDGHVSIRESKGKPYKWIRVSKGKYKLLHRVIWENHFGKIQQGINIQFKDGDSLNCDISNLYAVSRNDQVRVNKLGGSIIPYEAKKSIHLINRIKKVIHEKQDSRP